MSQLTPTADMNLSKRKLNEIANDDLQRRAKQKFAFEGYNAEMLINEWQADPQEKRLIREAYYNWKFNDSKEF